jgi:hypothetical protein
VWNGTTLAALSFQIPNAFTGCVTWHNHVWYWGDPKNPSTLFASDIDAPEGFQFMNNNGGGGTSGGYDIGVGDGDPYIRAVVPIGNLLYVFKTNSVYAISGYDFQSGEYQFQVQVAVQGYGVPSSECVAVLKNALVFWTGNGFYRLAVGAYEVEHIGMPIALQEGRVAGGNQTLVRAISADFEVLAALNNIYGGSGGGPALELFGEVALFAVDVGSGFADTVLVYDDLASVTIGGYAWSVWTGWNVAAWFDTNHGQDSTQTFVETPELFWIGKLGGAGPAVYQYGQNATGDSGAAIPWLVQTGWVDTGTPALDKTLHRAKVHVEAMPGAQFSLTITPSVQVDAGFGGSATEYVPSTPQLPATVGTAGVEQSQSFWGTCKPYLRGDSFLFTLSESSAFSSYEVTGLTLDYVEEAFLS